MSGISGHRVGNFTDREWGISTIVNTTETRRVRGEARRFKWRYEASFEMWTVWVRRSADRTVIV